VEVKRKIWVKVVANVPDSKITCKFDLVISQIISYGIDWVYIYGIYVW
jgi:hypothetical protein